jgi:hypothetical protein
MEPICECGHGQSAHTWHELKEADCERCSCKKFKAAADADRHPKWQRVPPGTVIPAGQPYRVDWIEGDGAHEYRPAKEAFQPLAHPDHSEGAEWFVDSSWRPPLELPTTPGSVIEARGKAGSCWLWFRGEHEWWINAKGATAYPRDLSLIRVLFDAGAER